MKHSVVQSARSLTALVDTSVCWFQVLCDWLSAIVVLFPVKTFGPGKAGSVSLKVFEKSLDFYVEFTVNPVHHLVGLRLAPGRVFTDLVFTWAGVLQQIMQHADDCPLGFDKVRQPSPVAAPSAIVFCCKAGFWHPFSVSPSLSVLSCPFECNKATIICQIM